MKRPLKVGALQVLALLGLALFTLRPTPHAKRWWANIERDPRVRRKIDGKIYGMTVAHVADSGPWRPTRASIAAPESGLGGLP